MADAAALPEELVERVLEKLGLRVQPEATREGLATVYTAWCRRIPFDNVRKLIFLRSGAKGPLPGNAPAEVFESWLEHGTGATCWANSGAMHALLSSLGFRAQRVLATIVFGADLPPNHGTTVVDLDDEQFLVDTSLLHSEPLLLSRDRATGIEHSAWGIPARFEDGFFWITVRPLLTPKPMECRLDLIGASAEQVRIRHEATRDWGPFNYALSVRVNRGDRVLGAAWGEAVAVDEEGTLVKRPFGGGERARWLVEEIGLSEEIVAQLPDDQNTPPPAGLDVAEHGAEGV